MNLVIVESPSKTHTISQYLGDDYTVVASKGHVRDIKNTGVDNLGIDIDNNYKPIYDIIAKQYSTIKSLNEQVSKADRIYLATDPDREGEAISWHLKEVLKTGNKVVKRIEFNEITKQAILKAIENPRDIDENLFKSQETRKIIDRIIGYELSSLLKKSIGSAEAGTSVSAGRVQSTVLRMITEREEKIKAFVPETYYEIEANFGSFKAKLYDGNSVMRFTDIKKAETIINNLDNSYFVYDIKSSTKYERPAPPLITSTLIQAASNKYSLTSDKTMMAAQKLYEGVKIGNKFCALITYMRTDSTRINDGFKKALIVHINNEFGKEYVGYFHEGKKTEDMQDAHEAIRPIDLTKKPDTIKEYLTDVEYKVYSLIYNQTVESMMKDAEIEVNTVTLSNNNNFFKTSFEKTVFDGFKVNRTKETKEKSFNSELGSFIEAKKGTTIETKQTEGPKRYTEASIINEMKTSGIGRPSTYASTIKNLKDKKYVEVIKKEFVPTEHGVIASKFLLTYFPNIVSVKYTAEMEETLEKIALGTSKEDDVVPSFYKDFMENYNDVRGNLKPMETGELCPICSSPLVFKNGRNGHFIACSNYPKCNYTRNEKPVNTETNIPCPECSTGHLTLRKHGYKSFYGCSNYPNCTFTISSLKALRSKRNKK